MAESTATGTAEAEVGAEAEAEAKTPDAAAPAAEQVAVHDAQLPEATEGNARAGGGQIDVLLDTTMAVEACLGQVEIRVRDLLKLGPGSVLKLDKQAGEPVDLLLQGTRFATGHLVVVGDRLGVKIAKVLGAGGTGTGG